LFCYHRFREGIESHAVIIGSYKPYQRPGYLHPSEITHKLRTQLIRIQQNNFRHSTLAQAEQSGPSNRNINSDLSTTVATTRANTITTYVSRRGEQNVPKRYLKEAEWLDKEYGWGYYTTSNDHSDEDTFIAVDFDFGALQWGVTRKLPDNGGFAIERPAPVKLGLRIYDEERVCHGRVYLFVFLC
jgi:hypothetical protein